MIHRLELALMLLLLLGSLMVAVLVTPNATPAVASADPLAGIESGTAEVRETDDQPLRLPAFDAFDEVGFGLLPDLAPRFAPGQP